MIRANSKENHNDIADEIYRLREEKHNVLAEDAEKKAVEPKTYGYDSFSKGATNAYR